LTATDVWSVAVDPNDHIYAGTSGGGVFRSTDNGASWTQLITGFDSYSYVIVGALAVNSNGDVFAGTTEGGGVYRSTDGGDSWALTTGSLSSSYFDAIAVNSSNEIFAGSWGAGVFKSTDNGDSWTAVNSGLNGLYVVSLGINSSGDLFAGEDFGGGIYRS